MNAHFFLGICHSNVITCRLNYEMYRATITANTPSRSSESILKLFIVNLALFVTLSK